MNKDNKLFAEPKGLNDVSAFHELFDLPIVDQPAIPSSDRCELRVNLLDEELQELKQAIADNDLVEVADALCDLQYVLSGAVLEFGLGDKFSRLFDNVQESNMSKACPDYDTALKTQQHYQETKGTESFIIEKGGRYLVYRKSDKKVLKSVDYKPTSLEQIIND